MICTLCHSSTRPFFEFEARGLSYHQCTNCHSVLLHPDHYPDPETEKAHYLTHENDVEDWRYQSFVSPIVDAVLKEQSPVAKGLDFGSGTGPVITKLLREQGYDLTTWDPFFDPNEEALQSTYDYIVCCEVIEHFRNPAKEFRNLYSLLNEGSSLYCMTQLYYDGIDFPNWRYKNDPTHLIFYHADAISFIQQKLGFNSSRIDQRLVIWKS